MFSRLVFGDITPKLNKDRLGARKITHLHSKTIIAQLVPTTGTERANATLKDTKAETADKLGPTA